MNLENLENKEQIIKEFFDWLFDDNRITNKKVILESEPDFTLAPYYMDSNIYYPKQIADFFNTQPMQRLGKISQLDLAIDESPNLYHNRLEHCKGTYYRKLEEMIYNFEKQEWKEYIENNNMKLYLLAELIKVAGHDIGHLPLSHALERIIFLRRGPHEIIGQRIMLENPEIQSVLSSISPELPHALKDLYENNILNFNQHDESNYDVDRLDYLSRDSLYAGNPIYIPNLKYNTIPVEITNKKVPKKNIDNSISTDINSDYKIDVYDYSSLSQIEKFLEMREKSYKNIYTSPNTHIRESSINALFNAFLSTESQSGINLKKFIKALQASDINSMNLSDFLQWDDLKFYSEILDIAENNEDPNIRLLATMAIPNMNAFLTMIYSHLNIYDKDHVYSEEEKKFLVKIKKIVKGNTSLSINLTNPNFASENTLVYKQSEPFAKQYSEYIKQGFINSSSIKIRAYNITEPIYIKDKTGKVYELSEHPDRCCNWSERISYINTMYSYIPFLKFNGITDTEICKLYKFKDEGFYEKTNTDLKSFVNMQPLKVENKIEDCFIEI